MIPLHQPERALRQETQSQYRARRKRSNEAAKRLRVGGEQRTPLRLDPKGNPTQGDPRGYWFGQHNATRAKRARRAAIRSLGIRQLKRALYEARDARLAANAAT
jgi:hypothetical protein